MKPPSPEGEGVGGGKCLRTAPCDSPLSQPSPPRGRGPFSSSRTTLHETRDTRAAGACARGARRAQGLARDHHRPRRRGAHRPAARRARIVRGVHRADEAWIVAAGATGEWAAQDGKLAARQSGNWLFAAPSNGMRLFDRSSGQILLYQDGWQRPTAPTVPSTGSVVDSEARAALADLLAALAQAGIFPGD